LLLLKIDVVVFKKIKLIVNKYVVKTSLWDKFLLKKVYEINLDYNELLNHYTLNLDLHNDKTI